MTIKDLNELIGKKFGRLTVLSLSSIKKVGDRNKFYYYLCKCDCGKEKIILRGNLLRGMSKSCGCLLGESRTLPNGGANFNSLLHDYKQSSIRRNIDFKLTEEQFRNLVTQNCYYCGVEPKQEHLNERGGRELPFIYNGIDRVDTSKGYTIDNCVSCCKKCNEAKHSVTVEICKKIMEFVKNK